MGKGVLFDVVRVDPIQCPPWLQAEATIEKRCIGLTYHVNIYIHVICQIYVERLFMEFRAPTVAAQQNAEAIEYLTKNLTDRAAGHRLLDGLLDKLGNAVDVYPDWHPIITAPQRDSTRLSVSFSELSVYNESDHKQMFVKGFITCLYSDDRADRLVEAVNQVTGLSAYRLQNPLFRNNAYPVVVVANDVEFEADGTIRSRDALAWFLNQLAKQTCGAQVAETWWNIRSNILGHPHGSRSSLFVNQETGLHMRKILEVLNNSGVFGPIREDWLGMLSKKKRDKISQNLIRAAIKNWDRCSENFEFELRAEICKAAVRDTWNDGCELSIRVEIGKYDLFTSGFYYAQDDTVTHSDPRGKRALAEKFL